MNDLVVVGGGVIGLSLAYEMSQRGHSVTVVDVKKRGIASVAGAGILIPANRKTAIHPLEQLRGLSHDLHPRWAERLLEETGINNGYVACGGVYVARTVGEIASLRGALEDWTDFEIRFQVLNNDSLLEKIPPMNGLESDQMPVKAVWVENESQIDNPLHIKALTIACQNRNVKIVPAEKVELTIAEDNIESVLADGFSLRAEKFCVSAGAWSEMLLQQIGIRMSMLPVRGQMVLYKLDERKFSPVIYEGSRYIVPRTDGHVLVGATIEEAGFDDSTTGEEIAKLKSFAESLIPDLNETTCVRSWAGLRPGTFDGFPYMGKIASLSNTYVSTGHFKAGLHLSTGSAVVLSDLMEGQESEIDLSPFDPSRANDVEKHESP